MYYADVYNIPYALFDIDGYLKRENMIGNSLISRGVVKQTSSQVHKKILKKKVQKQNTSKKSSIGIAISNAKDLNRFMMKLYQVVKDFTTITPPDEKKISFETSSSMVSLFNNINMPKILSIPFYPLQNSGWFIELTTELSDGISFFGNYFEKTTSDSLNVNYQNYHKLLNLVRNCIDLVLMMVMDALTGGWLYGPSDTEKMIENVQYFANISFNLEILTEKIQNYSKNESGSELAEVFKATFHYYRFYCEDIFRYIAQLYALSNDFNSNIERAKEGLLKLYQLILGGDVDINKFFINSNDFDQIMLGLYKMMENFMKLLTESSIAPKSNDLSFSGYIPIIKATLPKIQTQENQQIYFPNESITTTSAEINDIARTILATITHTTDYDNIDDILGKYVSLINKIFHVVIKSSGFYPLNTVEQIMSNIKNISDQLRKIMYIGDNAVVLEKLDVDKDLVKVSNFSSKIASKYTNKVDDMFEEMLDDYFDQVETGFSNLETAKNFFWRLFQLLRIRPGTEEDFYKHFKDIFEPWQINALNLMMLNLLNAIKKFMGTLKNSDVYFKEFLPFQTNIFNINFTIIDHDQSMDEVQDGVMKIVDDLTQLEDDISITQSVLAKSNGNYDLMNTYLDAYLRCIYGIIFAALRIGWFYAPSSTEKLLEAVNNVSNQVTTIKKELQKITNISHSVNVVQWMGELLMRYEIFWKQKIEIIAKIFANLSALPNSDSDSDSDFSFDNVKAPLFSLYDLFVKGHSLGDINVILPNIKDYFNLSKLVYELYDNVSSIKKAGASSKGVDGDSNEDVYIPVINVILPNAHVDKVNIHRINDLIQSFLSQLFTYFDKIYGESEAINIDEIIQLLKKYLELIHSILYATISFGWLYDSNLAFSIMGGVKSIVDEISRIKMERVITTEVLQNIVAVYNERCMEIVIMLAKVYKSQSLTNIKVDKLVGSLAILYKFFMGINNDLNNIDIEIRNILENGKPTGNIDMNDVSPNNRNSKSNSSNNIVTDEDNAIVGKMTYGRTEKNVKVINTKPFFSQKKGTNTCGGYAILNAYQLINYGNSRGDKETNKKLIIEKISTDIGYPFDPDSCNDSNSNDLSKFLKDDVKKKIFFVESHEFLELSEKQNFVGKADMLESIKMNTITLVINYTTGGNLYANKDQKSVGSHWVVLSLPHYVEFLRNEITSVYFIDPISREENESPYYFQKMKILVINWCLDLYKSCSNTYSNVFTTPLHVSTLETWNRISNWFTEDMMAKEKTYITIISNYENDRDSIVELCQGIFESMRDVISISNAMYKKTNSQNSFKLFDKFPRKMVLDLERRSIQDRIRDLNNFVDNFKSTLRFTKNADSLFFIWYYAVIFMFGQFQETIKDLIIYHYFSNAGAYPRGTKTNKKITKDGVAGIIKNCQRLSEKVLTKFFDGSSVKFELQLVDVGRIDALFQAALLTLTQKSGGKLQVKNKNELVDDIKKFQNELQPTQKK